MSPPIRYRCSDAQTTTRSSYKPVTRRWPPLPPPLMPSSPVGSGVCMATSGPGANPPAQRLIRRQTRPRARRRHRGSEGTKRGRRRPPAGGRPQAPVHGCRQCLSGGGQRRRLAAQHPRPSAPHRHDTAGTGDDHHSVRLKGRALRSARPRVQYVPSSPPHDSTPSLMADDTAIRGAADIINAGERVAILIGKGRGPLPRRYARSPTDVTSHELLASLQTASAG